MLEGTTPPSRSNMQLGAATTMHKNIHLPDAGRIPTHTPGKIGTARRKSEGSQKTKRPGRPYDSYGRRERREDFKKPGLSGQCEDYTFLFRNPLGEGYDPNDPEYENEANPKWRDFLSKPDSKKAAQGKRMNVAREKPIRARLNDLFCPHNFMHDGDPFGPTPESKHGVRKFVAEYIRAVRCGALLDRWESKRNKDAESEIKQLAAQADESRVFWDPLDAFLRDYAEKPKDTKKTAAISQPGHSADKKRENKDKKSQRAQGAALPNIALLGEKIRDVELQNMGLLVDNLFKEGIGGVGLKEHFKMAIDVALENKDPFDHHSRIPIYGCICTSSCGEDNVPSK
ncbi:hypothetical protein BCR34DRAFT_103603 [Clohesyomyces aquaticus]|uniref:Uncharacterized protein n=1 Tax=Clohesyomyces aquaticus TaxID=1231657 RepID=A0A1Y2A1G7_9PLEO|nr:hypothetical protein BCR34DRAFT_103603 [Clohesyomyces aquaticus]